MTCRRRAAAAAGSHRCRVSASIPASRKGGEISVHHDPLVAKLIADGETREIARRRAVEALRNYPILGIRTNVAFLIELLEHPRFIAGDIDTRFLDVEGEKLRAASVAAAIPAEALEIAAALRRGAADLSHRSAEGAAERIRGTHYEASVVESLGNGRYLVSGIRDSGVGIRKTLAYAVNRSSAQRGCSSTASHM